MNWEDWKNNIHKDFTKELVQKWQDRGLDYNQAEELINFSCRPTDIRFIKKGRIDLPYCYFWKNSNKYIAIAIINEDRDNGKRGAQRKYESFIDLLIYDGIERNPYHIEVVSGFFNEEEIKRKFELFKEELEGDNPILALLREGGKEIYLSEVIKEIRLERGNVINNPDNCIKKHDIISIEMDNRHGLEHAAVYLDNEKVAHISREENEGINNLRAQKDDWDSFLRSHKKAKKLLLDRPIIPFKESELVKEHIDIAVATEYGLGKYNLISNNCEHFATLCARGIPSSKQVSSFSLWGNGRKLERRKVWKTIERSSGEFAKLRIEIWLKANGVGKFDNDVDIDASDLPENFRRYQATLDSIISPSANDVNIDFQKEIKNFLLDIKREIAILHVAKYLSRARQEAENLPDISYRKYQDHIRNLVEVDIDVFVVKMINVVKQQNQLQAQTQIN